MKSLSIYSVCTCRDVNFIKFINKRPRYLCPNNFFFLTRYFGDTHYSVYNRSNLFLCLFFNCQFFQITPSGYALQNWELQCFFTRIILFETPCFRYLSQWFNCKLLNNISLGSDNFSEVLLWKNNFNLIKIT